MKIVRCIYKLIRKAFEISPILKIYMPVTIMSAGALPVVTTLLIQALTSYLMVEGAEFSLYTKVLIPFFVISVIIKCTYIYSESKADNRCTFVRMTIENELNEKIFECEYEQLENHQYINEKYPIFQSLASSSSGVEGILHDLLIGAGNFISFIALLVVIGTKMGGMVPIYLIYLIIGVYVFCRNSCYLQKYRGQETELKRKIEYIFHTASDNSYTKDIQIFHVDNILKIKFREIMEQLKKLFGVYFKNNFWQCHFWVGLATLGCMILGIGNVVFMVMKNQLTVDAITVCLYAILNLYNCTQILFEIISRITRESFAVDELLEYIEKSAENETVLKQDIVKKSTRKQVDKNWEWEVEHLSYRYSNTVQGALKDVSFHVKNGEKIAIVGLNGAGKSTLIKCMVGLYHNYEGKIYWRGIDIRTLTEEERCQMIGALFQDADIYPFRVVENVASVSEEYDLQRVKECLEKVGLKNKLYGESKLNQEQLYLKKLFDEQGIELSGGEAQKLMFARLLYKEPEVVFMDEATSKLDAKHEQEMLNLIFDIFREKTIFFVSHHLSVTSKMNRILVLKEGKILENGNHKELLDQKGEYYKMYMMEKEYYCSKENLLLDA